MRESPVEFMNIRIVPFSDEFTPGVKDLIVPIQRDEFGIEITYDDQPDLHDIPAFYRKGCGDFWIAVHDDEVVGSIALVDIGSGQAALRKMFVKETFRGGEHGVAKRLLETLVEHAHRKGVRDIFLGTTSKFLAAHRFYKKMGFDLVDEKELPKNFPRMAVDTRFYVRRFT
jgi:N-acetylglutamate synthase-like GNAT family acetyltransferase